MPIDCRVRTPAPNLFLYVRCYGDLIISNVKDFEQFFKNHLKNDHAFKMFIDLRSVNGAPMSCIKSLVTFMNECEEESKHKVIATSVLVGRPAIEKLVNILFSFKTPATPTKVTSDIEEACEYLNNID